ncbi:DUF2460 domain-containing protein [Sphingomonas sp. C3-2]|uniref:DUF2460 domain-containing protein n=1 Tax=Sphingomonas sp. C3-2 TaxID=3062169 RepID=UPI00294B3133|nr:DUF2460 domain-containing protein [Sphingomonas sp. C3-2]WOK36311.1 DUF2460 domain-containing protein [Sphingomonas sp. C3-2]
MGYWLANKRTVQESGWIKRFDPRFWTVNFPRPMMASVVTTAHDALRVDAVFYRKNDLAGLIWAAEDREDHPLLAYETARDFRGCTLSFRWRSHGLRTLDAVGGPTLTIEGRDAAGYPRAWYVRLWNYAEGAPDDARITLDFRTLAGGFALPGEADPLWAGDIDRMFISIVGPGYVDALTDAPLAAAQTGWVELSEMRCDGAGSVLAIGEAMVPEHGLSIATGYDDSYHLTPARMLRNALHLGYRGAINHYVGMSHYFRLEALYGGYYVSLMGGALNVPCAAWHRDLAIRAKALGFGLILSLSYELFDAHCWNDWKQRAEDGAPALTGWEPPSTLLSPAQGGAMGYLQAVARAFVAIARYAGQAVRFQVGEPWWWVMPDGRICLYDDAARAAFGAELVSIGDVGAAMNAAQTAMLDRAGAVLAASTAALAAAARDEAGPAGAETLLLVYLPSVLDARAPEVKRANVPMGWARPAFDVLQLEDYDWVTEGNRAGTARGVAVATARLGYPIAEQHYFSGFVLRADQAAQWRHIDAAADAARRRGTAETFIWALPQVIRDGFTHFDEAERGVQPFDDVDFPLALGREASVSPGFSTAIVTMASGHEQRNADWANARMQFDAGPGVRSEADMGELIVFFRARRGAARGFRFRDPFDYSSSGMNGVPGPLDQRIGMGDGRTAEFPLVKHYGEGDEPQLRDITRPVAGSVIVAVDGAVAAGWTLQGGTLVFDTPPAEGALVTAGYLFDVPVRFAEDRLEVTRATFLAGEVVSVPLIEIREDGR